jgi:hypothetical protein
VIVFTSHLKPGTEPVLIREGFSIFAALFGALWFAWRLAWIPAAFVLAWQLLTWRYSGAYAGVLGFGTMLLLGCLGRDLERWALSLRGFRAGPVVLAPDRDAAFARLLSERADLFADPAAVQAGSTP